MKTYLQVAVALGIVAAFSLAAYATGGGVNDVDNSGNAVANGNGANAAYESQDDGITWVNTACELTAESTEWVSNSAEANDRCDMLATISSVPSGDAPKIYVAMQGTLTIGAGLDFYDNVAGTQYIVAAGGEIERYSGGGSPTQLAWEHKIVEFVNENQVPRLGYVILSDDFNVYRFTGIDLSADFYFREYGWCYIYTNRPEVPLWSFAREDKPFTGFCALFEDDGDVVPWDTVSFGG